MRALFDPILVGGAPLRRLLLGLGAAGALAGCAQVLGIEPLSHDDPDGGSAIDAAEAAIDAPPADAAPAYAHYTCDWKPGSIRQINSLEGKPPPENEYGRIAMAPSERGVRAFVEYNTANGPVAEIWTISGDSTPSLSTAVASQVFRARRIGASRVGALVSIPSQDGSDGAQLALLSVLDEDDGDVPPQVDVLSPPLPTFNINAEFIPAGAGTATGGDLVVITSYRPDPSLPYRAELLYWDSASMAQVQPITFDEDTANMLGASDYDIVAVVRDGQDRNHVFLGSRFDEAMRTRHFILGDEVSGITAPVRPIEELLIGIQPRPDGSFLAGYAELDEMSGTLSLRIGEVTGVELATHEAGDLAATAPIGTLADIPSEGEPFFTQEHFVVAGGREADAGEEFALIIVHRTGQIRANQGLPIPGGVLPDPWRFKRIGAVVLDPFIFDGAGGDIVVTWTIEVGEADPVHDELYYGEIRCVPSTSASALR